MTTSIEPAPDVPGPAAPQADAGAEAAAADEGRAASEEAAAACARVERLQAAMRALAEAAGVRPSIFCRTRTPEEVAAEDMVPEWGNLKRGIRLPHHMLRSLATGPLKRDGAELLEGIGPRVKAGGRYSKPGVGTGRTFTSRFRGVHQTFPTRRWEAQFRRSGKPTSLGCFDREEDAACAYDRMMLWVEMHGAGPASKAGVTNFDVAQYADDLPWLAGVTQDELIEALRTEGRKQASMRSRPGAGGGGGGAAARGVSVTPEPEAESDWDGEEHDGEDGGARKRRRLGGRGGGGSGKGGKLRREALEEQQTLLLQQQAPGGEWAGGGEAGGSGALDQQAAAAVAAVAAAVAAAAEAAEAGAAQAADAAAGGGECAGGGGEAGGPEAAAGEAEGSGGGGGQEAGEPRQPTVVVQRAGAVRVPSRAPPQG